MMMDLLAAFDALEELRQVFPCLEGAHCDHVHSFQSTNWFMRLVSAMS